MNSQQSVKDLTLSVGNYTSVDNSNIKLLSEIRGVRANDLVVYSCLLHQSYIIGNGNFITKSFLTKFDIGRKQFQSSSVILEKSKYIKIHMSDNRFQRLEIIRSTDDLSDFSAISNSLLMVNKNVLSVSEKAFLILFWKHIQPSGNHLDLNYHNTTISEVIGEFATEAWFLKIKKSLFDKDFVFSERGNKFHFILNYTKISEVIGTMQIETDAKLTAALSSLEESNLKNRALEREINTMRKISDSKNSTAVKKGVSVKSISEPFEKFDYGIDI